MKRGIIFSIFIIIIIIILILLGYFLFTNSIPDTKSCDNLKATLTDVQICYLNLAINKSDIRICDKIEFSYDGLRLSCYENVGVKKKDLKICDKTLSLQLFNETY